MSKKYELTSEYIEVGETKLYRIKALKDFSNIKTGELGGFIEGEKNLSHANNAWVYGDAQVSGDALIDTRKGIIYISPIGSENGTLTAYQNKEKAILVTRGCFLGTLEEFKKAVNKTHGSNEFAKEYLLAIQLIENRFNSIED